MLNPTAHSLILASLQFSGINIIMQYTVEIFESADSSINEYLATIFVGVALLVSEDALMDDEMMPSESLGI